MNDNKKHQVENKIMINVKKKKQLFKAIEHESDSCHVNKNPFRHDSCAEKNSYRHDLHVNSFSKNFHTNLLCLVVLSSLNTENISPIKPSSII